MSKPSRKDPFDVVLSEDERKDLEMRLANEIRTGKAARGAVMDDNGMIDFAYSLYEQRAQQGISRNTPRYGSADLTSPIGTENVDSLSARATQTLFKLDPLWIVEGIGQSADKAPIVEEFMQWRQETVRLQKVCKRAFTGALVEYGGVLEVCEDAERTIIHADVTAAVMTNPEDGSFVLDGKTGKPMPQLDDAGKPVVAEEGAEATVDVHHVYPDYKRRGAYLRRRSMKNFMFLPNDAEDEHDVWAHATRFWMSLASIKRRCKDGEFDAEAVECLGGGDSNEKQQNPEADRSGVNVDFVPGHDTAQKELWRVQFWEDLDGKGLCFYTAIVSEIHGCILSLKYDWLQKFRTVYLNPYPCPYSVYGYSMMNTKLLTMIEEHTAWRNMNADRGTLKANSPILRMHGSQWDPSVQPFGADQVIDVNNPNEITMMPFEDVSRQAFDKEAQCVTDAQRVIGQNDIAIGQVSKTSRTLGENQMATQASFVRTDDPIGNLQEGLEEVGAIMHAIEVQTLKDKEDGMQAPVSVAQRIQFGTDTSFDGTFTAAMIEGEYRFKPRGSSESADPDRRRQTMTGGLNELATLAKGNPIIAQRMASPEFAEAIFKWWSAEYKIRDRGWMNAPLPPPMPPPGQPGAQPPGAPGGAPDFGGGAILQQLTAGMPQGVQ